MKKLFVFLVMVFFAGGNAWATDAIPSDYGDLCKDKAKTPVVQQCPIVKMTESCLTCHTLNNEGKFVLKEVAQDGWRTYPNNATSIIKQNKEEVGYFLLDSIDDDAIKQYFDYLNLWNIKKAIIEIQSPGGSLFGAWRIVGLMRSWESKGFTIETRCHGFAASAGFLIFASGTKGHRFVNEQAELMWHEVMSFKMFSLDTPSSSEEGARVLRHLQNTGNDWLSKCSKLSKEEMDEKIRNHEFWMNGKQAIEYGFADAFLNK